MVDRKCSKCDRPYHAKGLCKSHYERSGERGKRRAEYDREYLKTKPFKGRYKELQRRSKTRKVELTLSYDEYVKIIAPDSCHYCGATLPKRGYGLDRIDNSRGYSIDNVVPCCFACNSIRGNNLTVREMRIVAGLLKALREYPWLNTMRLTCER